MVLLGINISGCSSDKDDLLGGPPYIVDDTHLVEEGWHRTGEYIGRYSIVYLDGGTELGQGTMETEGWLSFTGIPSGPVIQKVMPSGHSCSIHDNLTWGAEEFGYISKSSSSPEHFTLYYPSWKTLTHILPGAYDGKEVGYGLAYGTSDITYDYATDMWEGDICIRGLNVFSSPTGGIEMEEIAAITPYLLHFKSIRRIIGNN